MSEETRTQRLNDIKARFAGDPAMTKVIDSAITKAQIADGIAPQEVVAQSLLALTKALTQANTMGSNLDEDEVKRILRADLADNRITLNDLDDTLKSLLAGKKTKYEITVEMPDGSVRTSSGTAEQSTLMNPLIQLILSDLVARNNVYLYGPAGTGKTYTAEVIAELLGWQLITVTCNQFTSPLNLIGGQTIEGYQEGLVTSAWGNLKEEVKMVDGQPQVSKPIGNVLLLDELPKLDPNTAGILNDALAKVKRQKPIENGKGEKIEMGNCFIYATGNVRLNEIDEDYVANFKQDLSLQDRFVGSCYPILVQYDYQVKDIMKGFLFIWEYMTDLQQAIKELGFASQAFVSNRILESLRDTQRLVAGQVDGLQIAPITLDKLIQPKSLMQGVNSFLSLFDEDSRAELEAGVEITSYETVKLSGREQYRTTRRMSMSLDDFRALAAKKTAEGGNFDVPKDDPDYGYDTASELQEALSRQKAHDTLALKVYTDN